MDKDEADFAAIAPLLEVSRDLFDAENDIALILANEPVPERGAEIWP